MAIYVIIAIVAVAVTLLIAVPVTANISVKKKTEKDAETIGTAEVKARSIIDEALKTAETKKREALLEAKEENLRKKTFAPKMNWRKRLRREEANFRSTKNVFCQRKRLSIKRRMPWKNERLNMQQRKQI